MSTRDSRRLAAFRKLEVEGKEAILIPLHGSAARRSHSRLMLDTEVWEELKRRYANHWSLCTDHGWVRVVGRLRPVGKPANAGRNPQVVLSRLIAGAQPGERVMVANGNPCDLRRSNLRVFASGAPKPERALPALGAGTGADGDAA